MTAQRFIHPKPGSRIPRGNLQLRIDTTPEEGLLGTEGGWKDPYEPDDCLFSKEAASCMRRACTRECLLWARESRAAVVVGPSPNPLPETRAGEETKVRLRDRNGKGNWGGNQLSKARHRTLLETQLHLRSLEDRKLPSDVRSIAPRNAGNSQVRATASTGWRREWGLSILKVFPVPFGTFSLVTVQSRLGKVNMGRSLTQNLLGRQVKNFLE